MVPQIPPEIFVGALTAISALAGAYLQSRVTLKAHEKAIEAENKRASADYLLEKEADALMELLESAERCYSVSYQYVNHASADGDVSDELAEEAAEALANFESTVRTNTVFLSEDDREAVDSLLGSVRTAIASGDHHIRGQEDIAHDLIDWEELMNDFEELRKVFHRLTRERISKLREETN